MALGLAGILFLLLIPAPVAEAGCVTPFFEEQSTAGSMGHSSIADLDGDGNLDIVSAGGNSLRLRAGNGTFVPEGPVDLVTGTLFEDVVAVDMNADGELDLVFSDFSAGQVGVLLHDSGFAFTGPSYFSAGSPKRIAIGDFNGDTRPDVYVTNSTGGGLYLQDENGSFQGSASVNILSNVRDAVAGDFNGDGKLDVVSITTSGLRFIPGNDDGTFGSTTFFSAGTGSTPHELEAADLDGDADLDLVTSDDASVSVSVYRNDGIAGWTTTTYSILPANLPFGTPRPEGLTLADFNDDGEIDIAGAGTRAGYVAVLTGNGDATFDDPSYTFLDTEAGTFENTGTLRVLTNGDFDNDGRIDILAEQGRIGLITFLANLCGVAAIEAEAPPVLSVGQTLDIPVVVASAADGGPVPTGSVSLLDGATVLDTETLVDGAATLSAGALSEGPHTLTVQYSGDTNYDPATSEAIPVTITTATTTVTVTKSATTTVWGESVTFTSTVTSTDNSEEIDGTVELFIDGVAVASGDAPLFAFSTTSLTVGTHDVYARYLGSENHPPSPPSAVITHTVNKVTSDLQIRSEPSYLGGSAIIEALINLPYVADATGTIQLFEGSTLVGTIDAAVQPRIFTLNGLSMGTHFFRAVYSGDSNVLGDESPVLMHVVLAQAGGLDARGATSTITLMWDLPPAGATQVRILRALATNPLLPLTTVSGSVRSYVDTDVTGSIVYRYRIEYLSSGGSTVAISNIDVAQLVTFTNDGDVIGVPIQSVHLEETRNAANALRGTIPLAPITTTYSGPVLATHINELRTAINEARVALGAPAFTFADTISPGTTIRAVHVQQLRDAVR